MSMGLVPYIMLDGNAREALQFYEKVLGAKVVFQQTFGEGPEDIVSSLPENARERLAHSVLIIGTSELYLADCEPGQRIQSGNKVNICLTASNAEESKQMYEALREGGSEDFPLQPTYFSPAYGMVTDKFGVTFQIFTKR